MIKNRIGWPAALLGSLLFPADLTTTTTSAAEAGSSHAVRTEAGPFGAGAHSVASRVSFPSTSSCDPVSPTGESDEVVVLTVGGGLLREGDEIAVRDGSLIVGSKFFSGTYPFNIVAWAGDPGHGLPGYTTGDSIEFELCNGEEDILLPGTAVWNQGGHFGDSPYSVAGLVTFPFSGACCSAGGTCSLTTMAACGLDWQGRDTVCDPNPCPTAVGACCADDGTCTVRGSSECAGTWQGSGTTCDPNPCPLPTGACCQGVDCRIETAGTCAAEQGRYKGNGTTCQPDACAQTPTETMTWGRVKNGFRL